MATRGRIMAIDPGTKHIGLAISDPNGLLATPFSVLSHVQLKADCTRIIQIAIENEVTAIIIGQPVGSTEEETRGMRHAKKLAEELAANTTIPVTVWDESYSTQEARFNAVALGIKRSSRKGHLDSAAAAMILQSYLDAVNTGLVDV
jgi:putative holliday junction resolvase